MGLSTENTAEYFVKIEGEVQEEDLTARNTSELL